MEKKFIIIDCIKVDPFSDDVKRVIRKDLYSLEEIEKLRNTLVWYEIEGEGIYDTYDELKTAFLKDWNEWGKEDGDYDTFTEFVESWSNQKPKYEFEVYEIKNDKVIHRKDLDTYRP